jgi:toluene monooxygenase system protein E
MSPRRTWWHLEGSGRVPTEYDIATSRLLYYPGRGFEVELPLSGWYERHQTGSPFACDDWERFRDPRATTYSHYVALQSAKEAHVDALFEAIERADGDRHLGAAWLSVLEEIVPPARYLFHGLQMAACYVAHMAPSGRIAICAMFQAADEMRRLQRFAYRMAQLRTVHPEFGADARRTWEEHPAWQGVREALERLLATYDWGEAFVALDAVLKPRVDAFFGGTLARAAVEAGEPLWAEVLASLERDTAWHREWSDALLAVAAGGGAASDAAVARWRRHWDALADSAAQGLGALLSAPSAPAARRVRR